MINTKPTSIETRDTSLENQAESSSKLPKVRVMEKAKQQLRRPRKVTMTRKISTVMSVSKRKSRSHQRNLLNWIDSSMLSLPSRTIAKSLQLVPSK